MADNPIQSRMNHAPHDVVQDLIFQRRSIRRYKDLPLPEEWIEAMLRCAHQAPSPSNRQPVRIIRVDTRASRDRLRQALADGHQALLARHRAAGAATRLRNRINVYRRYADFMFDAPVLLAMGVSTETKGFVDHLADGGLGIAGLDTGSDLDMTVGLAIQGLMLKAQALGVGSCVLTAPLVFLGAVEQLLGLASVRIKCFLTLGMPDETPGPTQRMPLDDVVKVV